MQWSKLLSREFLGTILAVIFAGVAMLKGIATFIEFSGFVGVVLGYYQTQKHFKEKKPKP